MRYDPAFWKLDRWLVVLLACLLAACSGAQGVAKNGDAGGASGKIIVGTDATFPPFESLDAPRRQIVGFDVDLMKAIAEEAGLQVEIVGTRYGLMLEDLAACRIDAAISAIPITEELKNDMLFSEPYFTNGQVVVVKKGNLEITGQENLAGMLVGVQKNTPGEQLVMQIGSVRLTSYSTAELAFSNLAEGLVDAVVADKLLALSYAGVAANDFKIVGDEFAAEKYGIAVCKENKALLEKINGGLAQLRADGTLAKLERKWLKAP